jgi:DNA-directed RNA polymerase specialized sigma24 family protein
MHNNEEGFVVAYRPGPGEIPALTLPDLLRHLSVSRRARNGGLENTRLGIDLARRGTEVEKLYYALGFAASIRNLGMDVRDGLQSLYLAIEVRNVNSPWNAAKSSFGHWIYMVARGLLSNLSRSRVLRPEDLTETGELDELVTDEAPGEGLRRDDVLDVFDGEKWEQASRLLALLESGHSRSEAVRMLGMDTYSAAKIVGKLREGARQ